MTNSGPRVTKRGSENAIAAESAGRFKQSLIPLWLRIYRMGQMWKNTGAILVGTYVVATSRMTVIEKVSPFRGTARIPAASYHKPREADGELRLAIGMLKHAIKDMRKPGLTHHRLSGIAWLVSSAATPWFDYVRMDQRFALERVGWAVHAADLIHDVKTKQHPKKPLSQVQIRVVTEGLEKLREETDD